MGNSNNDDAYVYKIRNLDESKVKDSYKIAFIGEKGTGVKTSLINRLQGIPFGEDLTSSNMKLKCNFKSSQKEMASCTVIEGQLPQ